MKIAYKLTRTQLYLCENVPKLRECSHVKGVLFRNRAVEQLYVVDAVQLIQANGSRRYAFKMLQDITLMINTGRESFVRLFETTRVENSFTECS